MSCVSCGRGSNYIWCKVQRVNTMCTLHLIFPIIFLIVFPDNFHFYPHKGIFNMIFNCVWIKEWSLSTSEFQFLAKLLKTCLILFSIPVSDNIFERADRVECESISYFLSLFPNVFLNYSLIYLDFQQYVWFHFDIICVHEPSIKFKVCFLLAPTGALIVRMCYFRSGHFFEILSISAIIKSWEQYKKHSWFPLVGAYLRSFSGNFLLIHSR